MATIDHDIVDYVPPSAKHLRLVLHALDRIERGARDAKVGAGQVDAAARRCASCRRRCAAGAWSS